MFAKTRLVSKLPIYTILVYFHLLLNSSCSATFECEYEGRFKYPSDCGSFYECILEKDEEFSVNTGSCNGQAFDEQLEGCVQLSEAEDCRPKSQYGSRSGRILSSEPEYLEICQNKTGSFTCANCKTLVSCLRDGLANVDDCGQGSYCEMNAETFNGGVCKESSLVTNCECSSPKSLEKDPYSTNTFARCLPNNDRDMFQCPDDLDFDPEEKVCSDNVGPCNAFGTFANLNNCSIYYSCMQIKDGWLRTIETCNDSYSYNENSGKCEDPCTFSDTQFRCINEGRFADPTTCKFFYVCTSNGTGGYKSVRRNCPDGYNWNNKFGSCSQIRGPCELPKRPNCQIPDSCNESE